MHFSRAFVAAAAIYLAPLALADEVESAEISRPEFQATSLKAPFLEQFTDDWSKRWQASNAKKVTDGKESEEEWAFVGNWEVEEPIVYKGIEGDKGLVLKDKAAHHAISAKFPKAIDNKKKTLVVQYEVKLQDSLECGGAYMKLLQDNKKLGKEEFSNASPYVIMFGPDKCGSTNKVHFIFKHKNPKTGEYEEKHLSSPPSIVNDKVSHLYTLIVNPDQTFEIRVDGEEKRKGSLLEEFEPAVNPPKEIDDPKDKKPEDWVEAAKIADPEATKPEDWDEDAPFEIVDEEAEKPEDWLDDEPSMVPDPEAEKPEDWDDEEDGDWVAPQVPNPKCAEASGCGPWEKPNKRNPDYKGIWTAPLIDNPEYKGIWKPRKIKNPNFFEDKTPANFEPMGAIGFELWTMQADILFDNIYIGHSTEDAEKFKNETFDVKKPIEDKEFEADKPKFDDADKNPLDLSFKDDPVAYIKERTLFFIEAAKLDPVNAIKTMPDVAGGIAALVVTVLAILIGGLGAGASSPAVQDAAKKTQKKAAEAKDQAAEAIALGADKAQAEINKRTTRSAAS